jgi:2-amino-4-hydroxy-6-hydroxymethyldihydropteridine diphosphokinase/dihydropteroate synthase
VSSIATAASRVLQLHTYENENEDEKNKNHDDSARGAGARTQTPPLSPLILICGSLYLAGNVLRDAKHFSGGSATSSPLLLSLPPVMTVENDVVIALGSNLGHRAEYISRAIVELGSVGEVTHTSALYVTAPQHIEDQPDFLNAAVVLRTRLSPSQLLGRLKHIERLLGRDGVDPTER